MRSADYTFGQTLIDVGNAADMVPPKGWRVGLGHRHNDNYGGPNPYANINLQGVRTADGVKNMSQMALEAYSLQSGRSVIQHRNSKNGGECIGYMGAKTSDASFFKNAIVPAATCLELPPANEWCNLVASQVTIDHGVLSVQNTTGTYDKSVAATVTCTAPTRIRLKFGQDILQLGGGVQSTLSTTPAAQGGLVSFPAGDTPIQVNSQLTVPPLAGAGVLAASTVLTVEFQ